MQHMYFFGYGSLVNAATHAHAPLYPATAKGWRRAWVAVSSRDICYLTAVRDPQSVLTGAIAPVPGTDWAALDAREDGYDRHHDTDNIQHDSPADSIAIYAVPPETSIAPSHDSPILMSYLDTVITGFANLYGEAGARDFFDTTTGWEAAVIDDRAAPRYPRTTPLSDEIRAIVDEGLARHQSHILRP